ncbi:MAG: cysteine desulfurase family protein, partial [Clostridia bacterium]
MREVYLDNAATTPLDKVVLDEMTPYLTEYYANSLSQHRFARPCTMAVDKARKQVADAIGAMANEIYFGSEADNWAIKGTAFAKRYKGNHIIISAIEHAAIMNSAEWLTKQGFEVTILKVDSNGIVDIEQLNRELKKETILVSIMLANNEIGVIEPISEISKIVHANGSLMHTDCVQAMGAIPVNVHDLGADLLTISAHKFYGPKGIGALYIRNGIKIDRLISGGGQERSMRGGTTNTAAVVGMGIAIENAVKDRQAY